MKIVNPATAIYLRKSREDAELETINEGETLARHKKTLMGVAERQGLNVTKIYEEIVSGDSIDERPEVQKLINELLQNRYQNIVVMEIQRLARGNTKDQGIILKALVLDKQLNNVAQLKAEDMKKNNYFDHNSPTLGSPFDLMRSQGVSYRTAGENIAAGQQSAEAVMNSWMNSSGHRANILNGNYTKLGVGFVSGGRYGTYWVQEFTG